MFIELASGQTWNDDHASIAVQHAEFSNVTADVLAQTRDEDLGKFIAVADVVVTVDGNATRPLRLARPLGAGQMHTVTHQAGNTLFAPRRVYTVGLRDMSRGLVATFEVEMKVTPAEAEIADYSQLPPDDRAFIDRFARRELVQREPTADAGPKNGVIHYKDLTLSRIFAGHCTLNPMSTGALSVTFWRANDGSRWYVQAGGCVAYRSLLYGPFK